ncbi:MAG: histidine phosphatase family protein [Bacteroidales bacterium]|nr:histidine phosphatase family protein [Bacteroidales bacterium]
MKLHSGRYYLILAGVLSLLLVSCTTTNIYLVRHAEKADNTANPPLSNIGFQRADILRDTLLNKDIDSIFVSGFLRTQQTAQPLCDVLDMNYVIYNKDSTEQLIHRLKKIKGKNVLVVGHSDNVPEIISILSNRTVNIPETVFDRMYIVTIKYGLKTTTSLKETTYGQAL